MKTQKLQDRPRGAVIGRWYAFLVIVAGMLTLVLPQSQAAAPKKEITDHGITLAVERELRLEKGVSPDLLDVSTSQGIVTLAGSVDNILAKERAVKIAESVRGVLGVVDRSVVTPVSRSDEDIRKDILMALLQDPATDSYQVSVSVRNAVATLTGSVGSHAEQQLAARIAKGVKGLKELDNKITINYSAKRTDAEIAADIKARLQWDIWINGGQINPALNDGNVTLTGTVGSAISKSRAFDDSWMNGVTSVDDSGLKVNPEAGQGALRTSEYAVRTDSEIKQAVQAALSFDPRVSVFSPDVTVEDGVVILGGSVGNLRAKTAAAQDAANVIGVSLVDNFLQVRPSEKPSDAEMQKELKAALYWDPMLDTTSIDVGVVNRVAYLSGAVDSSLEMSEAQDVASRIKGVVAVVNHLKVEPDIVVSYGDWPYYPDYGWPYSLDYDWPYYNQPPDAISDFEPEPYLSDEQIKKNIEDSLFWSPFVDRNHIKVTVDGGVATLTGTVGTWIGYGEAYKDAHKSGATAVRMQVKVT